MGPGNLLRLLRAFRVFRLFKRIKSLNKIIVSLGKAIPGVANAFLIMVIFMCIFAILGVEFFSQFGPDGTMTTYQDHGQRGIDWTNLTGLPIENGDCDEINGTVAGGGCVVVPLVTARGYTYGEEYYGTFFRALYTLFQVMTGESWSEAVARPTLFGYVNPQIGAVLTGLFYVSFIIITQIIMINVRRAAQFAATPAHLSPHSSDARVRPSPLRSWSPCCSRRWSRRTRRRRSRSRRRARSRPSSRRTWRTCRRRSSR